MLLTPLLATTAASMPARANQGPLCTDALHQLRHPPARQQLGDVRPAVAQLGVRLRRWPGVASDQCSRYPALARWGSTCLRGQETQFGSEGRTSLRMRSSAGSKEPRLSSGLSWLYHLRGCTDKHFLKRVSAPRPGYSCLCLPRKRQHVRRLNLRCSTQIIDRRQASRSGVKRTSRAVPAHPRTSSVPTGPAGQDPARSLRLGSILRATPAGCPIGGQAGRLRRTPSCGTFMEQYNSLKCRSVRCNPSGTARTSAGSSCRCVLALPLRPPSSFSCRAPRRAGTTACLPVGAGRHG